MRNKNKLGKKKQKKHTQHKELARDSDAAACHVSSLKAGVSDAGILY